jgi:hypothetical protein
MIIDLPITLLYFIQFTIYVFPFVHFTFSPFFLYFSLPLFFVASLKKIYLKK